MKKLTVILLTLAMVLGMAPAAVAATSGDFTYELLADGTAEITAYTGSATELVIPDTLDGHTVTSIGEEIFIYCEEAPTGITIPASVTHISIEGLLFAYDLTYISVNEGNPNYRSVNGNLYDKTGTQLLRYAPGKPDSTYTVPNGITAIGNYALCMAYNLTDVVIPDGVTVIGDGAFTLCPMLTAVTLPNSITAIGESAFMFCVGLTGITIPIGLTKIGADAFAYCTSLTEIAIPAGVTEIGSTAFAACISLNDISVDASNPNYSSLDGVLLNKAKTELLQYAAGKADTAYTVPNDVTIIAEAAFYGAANLIEVTLPDSLTTIGSEAFSECYALTRIAIPNSVTDLGNWTFSYCESLTEVTLPGQITEIGEGTFSCCFSLTCIRIPNGVTVIGEQAFDSCESMVSAIVPSSVTAIGDCAFDCCPQLTIYGSAGSAAAQYASENDIPFAVWGDIDENGEVTAQDALTVLRMVVGLDQKTDAADVDGDSEITAQDALTVLRIVVGLE